MTPAQQNTLTLIDKLNLSEFNSWFYRSTVMAFVQIESDFVAHAYRKEPSGVASYGLMQVLDVTAKSYGIHDAVTMYDPETSLRIGMHVLFDNWNYLTEHLGSEPSYNQWVAAYNEGCGNVLKGRTDTHYVDSWKQAKRFWQFQLNDPVVI